MKHLAAIVVAFGLFCFLGFILLVGVGSLFQAKPVVIEDGSVLVVDLGIKIYDSPASLDPIDQMISEFQGLNERVVPLRQLLDGLEEARRDDRVSGLLLTGTLSSGGLSNSLATLTEVRAALARFQASGKKIFAFTETDGLGELYLKSVAEAHWMDPYGLLDYRGLAAQIPYLGGIFERYGVEYQVVRAGKFKSAGEAYVQREMSPETEESLGLLLAEIWLQLREEIAASTAVPVAELDALADDFALMVPDKALEAGLVDELVGFNELQQRLIDFAGFQSAGRTFKQVDLSTYLDSLFDPLEAFDLVGGNQLAVVYAEGVIVDGKGDFDQIGGDHFARILRRLRKDDDVKAIVLRVNSPGGSATASELIAREVALTNAEKPVVVSMGGYAASGGYYISALADTIFAQPTTITGSIGVVTMLPNIEELAERFEVNIETVQTNRNGTLWSLFNSKSEEQLELLDQRVEHSYALFLRHVAEGRELTLEQADDIAQGREWSGVAARERALVDRFGGLREAIDFAADLAGIGDDYAVEDYPSAITIEDMIAEIVDGGGSPMRALAPRPEQLLRVRERPLLEQLRAALALSDRHHLYSYSSLRVSW